MTLVRVTVASGTLEGATLTDVRITSTPVFKAKHLSSSLDTWDRSTPLHILSERRSHIHRVVLGLCGAQGYEWDLAPLWVWDSRGEHHLCFNCMRSQGAKRPWN